MLDGQIGVDLGVDRARTSTQLEGKVSVVRIISDFTFYDWLWSQLSHLKG